MAVPRGHRIRAIGSRRHAFARGDHVVASGAHIGVGPATQIRFDLRELLERAAAFDQHRVVSVPYREDDVVLLTPHADQVVTSQRVHDGPRIREIDQDDVGPRGAHDVPLGISGHDRDRLTLTGLTGRGGRADERGQDAEREDDRPGYREPRGETHAAIVGQRSHERLISATHASRPSCPTALSRPEPP